MQMRESSRNGRMENRTKVMVLSFIAAYLVSRLIFWTAGFDYHPGVEGFKAGKLAFDLGTWGLCYFISFHIIRFFCQTVKEG